MKNSIEEDITKINTYVELVLKKDYCNCNELNTILGKHCDGSKNVAYAMQHILSDYKRVLKENEKLKAKWDKDTHISQNKLDYANADRIDLAQQNKELRKENEGLNNRCRNLDTEAQAYLEELAGDNTLTKRTIKQLQKENEELKNKYATFIKMSSEVIANSILKSKLKEFFSSRLEKYQEADDGKYEQDYLTRGELELVDRYKECKEIAKIILEEEINSEVPQNCIPKSLVEEKIEELNKKEQELQNSISDEEREEYSDANISFALMDIEVRRSVLQDLLERGEGR